MIIFDQYKHNVARQLIIKLNFIFFLTHLIQNITQKQYFLDLTLSSNIYLLMIKMPVIPFKMFTQTWAKFGFPLCG